ARPHPRKKAAPASGPPHSFPFVARGHRTPHIARGPEGGGARAVPASSVRRRLPLLPERAGAGGGGGTAARRHRAGRRRSCEAPKCLETIHTCQRVPGGFEAPTAVHPVDTPKCDPVAPRAVSGPPRP